MLIAIGGAFAAMETALTRPPRSEVSRLAAENRRGAAALAAILDAGPPPVNAAVLLRVACEMAGAVCTTPRVAAVVHRWWLTS